MAKPSETYPASATNASDPDSGVDGETAIREALQGNGEGLARALDHVDELGDVLTTAILIVASAEEDDVQHVTDSTANLIAAADGITTADTAEMAEAVGANAGELTEALELVLEVQRDGHLDDLVTLATAFTESLSSDELDRLATLLEEDGEQLVASLDLVLELQRDGHLEDLLEMATVLAALDIDEDTVDGLNALLGAVGSAQRAPRRGLLGSIRVVLGRNGRAGIGYLGSILAGIGDRTED